MSKVLHLNLSRKWFDMIKSGEKKEVYREVKEYWIRRLVCYRFNLSSPKGILTRHEDGEKNLFRPDYGIVEFRNGYAKNAPSFQIECKGIDIGEPKPEWTNENWQGQVFRIKLGNILTTKQ